MIPRNKLQTMSLEDLYRVEKITPSVTKRILMLEDFSSHSPDYCRTHCQLPASDQCGDKHRTRRNRVDVLILRPRLVSDSTTKYGRDNPGWREDAQHERILTYLTEKFLGDLQVDVSNVLRCRPTSPKVTVTTLKRCVPYLRQEILTRRPRMIIALGKEVSQALGIAKPKRGQFDPLETEYGPIPVLTTLHPKITCMIRQNASGDFWGPDYLTILERDFKKAGDIASGRVPLKDLDASIKEFEETKLFIAQTVDDVLQLERDISNLPPMSILSWDTETTSLDPWSEDARLLCIQFSFRHRTLGIISVVVPLWHRENRAYNPDDVWPIICRILLNPQTVKIGHNLSFDIMFLRVVYGIDPANVHFDTMLLLHSLNSGLQGFYDLKTSVADLLYETGLTGYEDRLDLKALKKKLGEAVEEDTEESLEAEGL